MPAYQRNPIGSIIPYTKELWMVRSNVRPCLCRFWNTLQFINQSLFAPMSKIVQTENLDHRHDVRKPIILCIRKP